LINLKKIFVLWIWLSLSVVFALAEGEINQSKFNSMETLSSNVSRYTPPEPVEFIAEFEPMQGVLIRYPLGVPYSLIKSLSETTTLYILIGNSNIKEQAVNFFQANGVNLENCEFIVTPTDSYWTRDYSPWFIRTGAELAMVDFNYNRPRPNDNRIPKFAGGYFGLDVYDLNLYHTGGNMMVDGMGKGASTDLVLKENANFTKEEIELRMKTYLGIEEYFLYPEPTGSPIEHIDTWAKFIGVDKLMIRSVPPTHPKYEKIEGAVNYFSQQISSYGTPYQIFRVNTSLNEPYANSLIVNDKVYVPQMNTLNDKGALDAFKEAMPGYEVIGFTGTWLSDDALHCRTYGIPDLSMIHISHVPLPDYSEHTAIPIQAKFVSYSGASLQEESLKLYWKTDESQMYSEVTFTSSEDNYYQAFIPAQESTVEISYYLSGSNELGKTAYLPLVKDKDPFRVKIKQMLPLQSPENVAIQFVEEKIILSWDLVPEASSYKVEFSTNISDFTNVMTEIGQFREDNGRIYWETAPEGKIGFYRIIAVK